MVKALADRSDGDFYLEADITGGVARCRSLTEHFPHIVLDDLRHAGPVYRMVKDGLDPDDLFFPTSLKI
jgi:hypothetical protein